MGQSMICTSVSWFLFKLLWIQLAGCTLTSFSAELSWTSFERHPRTDNLQPTVWALRLYLTSCWKFLSVHPGNTMSVTWSLSLAISTMSELVVFASFLPEGMTLVSTPVPNIKLDFRLFPLNCVYWYR